MEIREPGGENVHFVLTRWVDLGPGLNTSDDRYIIHFQACNGGPYVERLKASDMLDDPPRLRFEMNSISSEVLSDDERYLWNASLLRDQRYQTVMEYHSRNIYTRFKCGTSWGQKTTKSHKTAVRNTIPIGLE